MADELIVKYETVVLNKEQKIELIDQLLRELEVNNIGTNYSVGSEGGKTCHILYNCRDIIGEVLVEKF